MLKGEIEYRKFKKGMDLTYRQAVLAQCYICNGANEGGVDCRGISCPLYRFMPYRKGRVKKVLNNERRQKAIETLKIARAVKNNAFVSANLSEE